MNKIRVALVDDEYLERTLIRCSAPWDEMGFSIVGEADSGEQMMQKMDSLKPDVVFADICMPFMDGLQMSENIKERYSDVEVVIITGHRDFEYAQQAIHIGVSEYLLKPVNRQELLTVSQKIKNRVLKKWESGFKDQHPGNRKYSEIVDKAIDFIHESISDKELSLKSIAEKLYVNPSYLCRVFKRDTNENVTNYILKIRIRQSLDYLNNTTLKAYEIAEKVGFSDPHYFSILFKKQMGESIQEYKRLNLCRFTDGCHVN